MNRQQQVGLRSQDSGQLATISSEVSYYLDTIDAWSSQHRTDRERRTWETHLELLLERHNSYSSSLMREYNVGFEALRVSPDRIPSLDEINVYLSPYNWRAVYVRGMVPDRLYQEMLSAGIFPVAREFRDPEALDHVPVPDFLHDVLGHIPLLSCASYRALIAKWATTAIACRSAFVAGDTRREVWFGRFYTWSLEFGLVGDPDGACQILGAAILSSPGEWDHCETGPRQRARFGRGALNRNVDYDVLQPVYFTVKSIDDYTSELEQLHRRVKED